MALPCPLRSVEGRASPRCSQSSSSAWPLAVVVSPPIGPQAGSCRGMPTCPLASMNKTFRVRGGSAAKPVSSASQNLARVPSGRCSPGAYAATKVASTPDDVFTRTARDLPLSHACAYRGLDGLNCLAIATITPVCASGPVASSLTGEWKMCHALCCTYSEPLHLVP